MCLSQCGATSLQLNFFIQTSQLFIDSTQPMVEHAALRNGSAAGQHTIALQQAQALLQRA
ncbi:hypothetical protein H9646_06935 [Comamonas sp. Sa2CVA6]|uniref:Uncharacterized protein n=1 Tax=Comamonas avium TaxID=2762231 RepID=A0ABR8S9Q0_9BURK|nr:hypothetical protein [Comamonas avium]